MARTPATTLAFLSWRQSVDQFLMSTYAITIEDAGLCDQQLLSHWKEQESPNEFVSWFGAKYELQSTTDAYGLRTIL